MKLAPFITVGQAPTSGMRWEEIFALDDEGQATGHFRLRPAMLTDLQSASNSKGSASPWAIGASDGRQFAAVESRGSTSLVWYTIPK
jgi:hypothetical protein